MTTRIAHIPFSGFYESSHDAAMDEAMGINFGDDCGETDTIAHDIASDTIDWRVAHLAYAQEYASNLAAECNATWQFAKLYSPREYNFGTDQIDVTIDLPELQRMYEHVTADPAEWLALCERRLTARSGFIPFYSSDPADWGNLDEWEAPQLSLLIECYCDTYCTAEWRDWECVDDCNGAITRCIETAIPQTGWDRINALEAQA